MKKVIVIAPHADDETLGCGGTLLRHRNNGDQIYWVIVTEMTREAGFSSDQISKRENEIKAVANLYGFENVYRLGFPAAELDTFPMGKIVEKVCSCMQSVQPNVVYLPFPGDIHTDHQIVFESGMACTKWFRSSNIERILVFETLSETEAGIHPVKEKFNPNVYVNISSFVTKKLQIMKVYQSEIGTFPFPRSEEAIKALSAYRGAASGFESAEAFMLIKEVN